MFIKSEASNAIINSDLIHKVEIRKNDDEDFNLCYEVVALTSHRSTVLFRTHNRQEAQTYLDRVMGLLNRLKKRVRCDINFEQ